jgi:hypothetical protein
LLATIFEDQTTNGCSKLSSVRGDRKSDNISFTAGT